MAYDKMTMPGNGGGAGMMGGESGGAPDAPEKTPRDDTFVLPEGFPGADTLKPGDTVTLKVVANEDGSVEVEHVGGAAESDEEPSMAQDMRASGAFPQDK